MQEFEIEFDITPNEYEIDISDKVVELKPSLENLEVTPSSEEQVFKHEDSYGYDEVKVNAIHDDNLVADNIKKGVEILGVQGNLVGGKFAPRYLYQPICFFNYTGTELDYEINMIDTTNFTTMAQMFRSCSNITSLDLSEWNTSNVTNMSNMFTYCESITELDLSNFDTSKVTNMSDIFNGMSNLTSLNLSSWDTSNVTNMNYMFYNCKKLQHLDIRNFTFDKVTGSTYTFHYMMPNNCLIIVKGETEKQWVLARNSNLKNVKTVAEYEAEM